MYLFGCLFNKLTHIWIHHHAHAFLCNPWVVPKHGGEWVRRVNDVALSPPYVKWEYNTWLCQEEEAAATLLHVPNKHSLKVSPLLTDVWPNNKQHEPICLWIEREVVQMMNIFYVTNTKPSFGKSDYEPMQNTSKNSIHVQPPAVHCASHILLLLPLLL